MQRLELKGFGGIALAADGFGLPDDPPVVLIPTGGQTREYWHASAQALADAGRYAICVDLRGHGDSAHAPDGRYDLDAHVGDLRTILAGLPMRASLVASGLGAMIALVAVGESEAPLVTGMALIGATVSFDRESSARMSQRLAERVDRRFANRAEVAADIAAFHPSEPSVASDRLMAAFAEQPDGSYRWRGDARAFENNGLTDVHERLRAAAGRVAVPVTLIRGSLNETISREATSELQALLGDVETAEAEGVGHHAAEDQEDAFNALLLDFLERRVPRQAVTYQGGSEPRTLRDALGCFGTGVTVVTSFDADGNPIGLTANSFTSVSLDPPLILFSLVKASGSLPAFVAAGRFAVNVLHIGQQPVANRFARRDAPRFEEVDWGILSENGSPVIAGSLASFDCETYATHDGGDHLIFIGKVHHAWFEPHRDPLLYFRGKYRRLHFV